jgi:hypothetical protein
MACHAGTIGTYFYISHDTFGQRCRRRAGRIYRFTRPGNDMTGFVEHDSVRANVKFGKCSISVTVAAMKTSRKYFL